MLVVAFNLLSGGINVKGLLADKETENFSPGRLQLLFATVVGAAVYLSMVIEAKGTGAFPPVPAELVTVVGASNTIYLAGKIYSRFFSPRVRRKN